MIDWISCEKKTIVAGYEQVTCYYRFFSTTEQSKNNTFSGADEVLIPTPES
ncbi:hypothetical protein GCM10010911_44980 [Paenibacillus nasutitermitis]|uniref:Uncharacterized protein n=1 Tax=Paenibacillus nasutitermitis TaxID=1652958 RepID=A0A917DZA6_9BACL|nr:hypothetical protein GCM10010911_44980 [Paenibacillus nasutitermitis]